MECFRISLCNNNYICRAKYRVTFVVNLTKYSDITEGHFYIVLIMENVQKRVSKRVCT